MLIGALLGGFGSIVNTGLSIYQQRQQNQADEKKRSDEFEMAKFNAQRDIDVANITSSKDTMIASYEHDTASGTANQWVIDVLRLVRPAITFYSLMFITLLWFEAADSDKAIIVASALDIAAMSVAWWFGDRGVRR